VEDCAVEVIDPVADYLALMRKLFDFRRAARAVRRRLPLAFDAMHAVTGPYAHAIFERELGAAPARCATARRCPTSAATTPTPTWCTPRSCTT
jgi:phosphoglucomutase